jgi:hypothetical protein
MPNTPATPLEFLHLNLIPTPSTPSEFLRQFTSFGGNLVPGGGLDLRTSGIDLSNPASTLSLDHLFASSGSPDLSSGLPAIPSLPDLAPTFSDTGSSDLVSGLSAPSGASDATALGTSDNPVTTADPTQDLSGEATSTGTFTPSTTASTSFYNTVIGDIVDFLIRGGVFLVGAIMLAAAAYAFTREG